MSIMTGTPAPAQTAPAPPPADEIPTASDGRKRLFLLAGGGVAVIAVAALAYFFLLSGGSSDTGARPPLPIAHTKVSGGASASSSSPSAVQPLKTFAGKTARNPFKTLDPPKAASGTTGSTGTTTGTNSGTTTGTTTPATTGGTTTGSTTGTTGTTTPHSSVPLTVTLTSIASDQSGATVSITPKGGKAKAYTPKLGATFDTYFQLTGFAGAKGAAPKCILMQYGDSSAMVCEGDVFTVQP